MPVVVAYPDPGSIDTVQIEGAGLPYFGSRQQPASAQPTTTLVRVRASAGRCRVTLPAAHPRPLPPFHSTPTPQVLENGGLAPGSDPACASPQVSLLTPCTQQFTATRAGQSLFVQPLVSVSVAPAADGWAVSHCQGGVLAVGAAGTANGTFFDRATGSPTFAAGAAKAGGGDTVAVTVTVAQASLACTLLYTVPQGGVEALLG